jgi:CubicO group peptidase (beta-lactamase class C family)
LSGHLKSKLAYCPVNCVVNAKSVQFCRTHHGYLRHVMKNLTSVLLVLFSVHTASYAQQFTAQTVQTVDSIFKDWQTSTGPGCTVVIVNSDSVLYSNGFGLANLENNIRNSPGSVYYLASLSKQFTGYCMATLIKQGKVRVDDDIRTYLPWIPDYGVKISVANLLHHTSGLRDYFTLLPFTGFNLSGELSQDAALALIKKQRTLNFNPGEKFSYCNTNYVLLSEIVEKVSQKSFPAYLDSTVYRPLHMRSSEVAHGTSKIIKNRADSYAGGPEIYGNVTHNIYTQGDGGMFSTSTDLAQWMRHLIRLPEQDSSLAKLFTSTAQLRNSRVVPYAMGIIPDTYFGRRRLTHKGALAGYKNFMAIYPEDKIGILILTNGDDGPKTNRAMEAVHRALFPVESVERREAPTGKALVNQAELTGEYVARNGSRVSINIREGKLLDGDQVLLPFDPYSFFLSNNPMLRYHFKKAGAAYDLRIEKPGPNAADTYKLVTPGEKPDLKGLIGSYTSNELDFDFTISPGEDGLWLTNKRHGRFKLTALGADHLFVEQFFMDHLLTLRDSKGKITALEYTSGDTAGLRFRKK